MPFYNILPWYSDISDAPRHYNTQQRNQTLAWTGTDSQEAYQKNLQDPNRQKLLEKYKHLEYIEYRFNNHGFRSEAFDERPAGLALGCSFTEGTGLPLKDAWPSVLSNMLGGTYVWNLGTLGASFDTVFRLLDFYITKFNPKFICILTPPINRFEYCDIDNRYVTIRPMELSHQQHQPHLQFAKEWLAQKNNGIQNRRKNMLAIKQLCHEANVPVFFDNSNSYFTFENKDYARDLIHYGPTIHKHIATQFYNELNKHDGI